MTCVNKNCKVKINLNREGLCPSCEQFWNYMNRTKAGNSGPEKLPMTATVILVHRMHPAQPSHILVPDQVSLLAPLP